LRDLYIEKQYYYIHMKGPGLWRATNLALIRVLNAQIYTRLRLRLFFVKIERYCFWPVHEEGLMAQ